ncbi:hypothetical protein DFH09DRAFT_933429 [Mycena vulgaris]|nr:hypothetical protein DFH09DRAFT_933429 [Mycena vulgaris]
MWNKLWEQWKDNANLPLPSLVLGDWNFVEDAKDRLSTSNTRDGSPSLQPVVPASFQRLKSLFQMEDGRRRTFPRIYLCTAPNKPTKRSYE